MNVLESIMVEQTNRQGKRRSTGVLSNGSNSSLVGRIGSSTTALLREAVVQPRPDRVRSTLSAVSSWPDKGGASSSASQYQLQQHEASGYVGLVNNAITLASTEAFRTRSSESLTQADSAQHEFDIFKASLGSESSQPLVHSGGCSDTLLLHKKHHWAFVDDGAAVVNLLSEPSTSSDDMPSHMPDFDSVDAQAQRLRNKAESQDFFDQRQPDLSAGTTHRTLSSENSLHLIPNFGFDDQVTNESQLDTLSSTAVYGWGKDSCHEPSAFGQSHDLEPWLEILTRYQDEVWGDMLPLVRKAREELKDTKSGFGKLISGRPAVRRLGIILGHLHNLKSTFQPAKSNKPPQSMGLLAEKEASDLGPAP